MAVANLGRYCYDADKNLRRAGVLSYSRPGFSEILFSRFPRRAGWHWLRVSNGEVMPTFGFYWVLVFEMVAAGAQSSLTRPSQPWRRGPPVAKDPDANPPARDCRRTSAVPVSGWIPLAAVMKVEPEARQAGSERPADAGGKPPISLLICDDHRILGDALAMLIRMDTGLNLLADPFNRADAAIEAAVSLTPDVVLMDVQLPGGTSGIDATRAITARSPKTKVVVMSGSGDPAGLLVEAIEAGAAGFLPKTEAANNILASIRAAANGESLLAPATLAWAMRRVSEARSARREIDQRTARLTEREREILQRMSEGESNGDIAADLFLSIHTINTHVRNILVKLEVHSKLQAVTWAVKSGAIAVNR
jgi:DNA-binding NarL/FixJ family response regulator